MEKQILCTIGPASLNESVLRRLNELPVTLLRVNMSHTKLSELPEVIKFIKTNTNIPICLDSEGAQIRTGHMIDGSVLIQESRIINIHRKQVPGDAMNISFYPSESVNDIQVGDLISIDFNTALVQVINKEETLLQAKVITEGLVRSNKAVSVNRQIYLNFLTERDYAAIKIGLEMGLCHFALSFANSREDVRQFREIVGDGAFVIAKIESRAGLLNLKEIAEISDAILIDRGDLSREEPIECIPLLQKYILNVAKSLSAKIFVATNFLETMITSPKPSRSECNDVLNTLIDGADGIVLAEETAIGQNPIGCVNMISQLIQQYEIVKRQPLDLNRISRRLLLIEPHGGILVNRVGTDIDAKEHKKLKKIEIDEKIVLDCQQIATGVYSPLEGFMTELEMENVLENYRLSNGVVWTLPIILQLPKSDIYGIEKGHQVILVKRGSSEAIAILHVEDVFPLKFESVAKRWFGTASTDHVGVAQLKQNGDYIIGGKIDLISHIRVDPSIQQYVLTPKDTRFIFEQKNWFRIVGFHTRNIIHRAHEFIQKAALEEHHCDGIFISPVIGPKKSGDFHGKIVMGTYQLMLDYHIFMKNKVLLGSFHTYSRYSGPREAVFTVLCRKNFGCTHFIIGRDHTGVGNFYAPDASRRIFDEIGEIGIKLIFFDEVAFCPQCSNYVLECSHPKDDLLSVSGTEIRNNLNNGRKLPDWLVREEINEYLIDNVKNGEPLFFT
jgi:pyruvate kinase